MEKDNLLYQEITGPVIGAFFEVYNELGFGFLEYIYVAALERELRSRGHKIGRQVSVPVYYKEAILGTQRIDMIVDDKVIIEVKATKDLPKISTRQLDNYLKGTGMTVGLILHFGERAEFYRRVWTKTINNPVSA